MSQSQQPSQLALSYQIKQLNIGSENPNDSFKIELSIQQASFLTKLLPFGYSLQIEPKSLRRLSSTTKIPKEQPKLPVQVKKKSTKDEPKNPNTSKMTNSRSQKANINRFTQENENAVYQKYNSQKEYRRNTFENVSQALKPCVKILTLLKNSKTSWPFRQPVDPIALGIPHYTEIIKQPMDLSTIENNLRTNQYITPTQFHADVSKIITNSYTFNAANIQFTRITAQFENYYTKIRNQQSSDFVRTSSYQQPALENYGSKVASLQSKKSKKQSRDHEYNHASQNITMTEKKELGLNIKKLPKQYMKGILDIVNEGKAKPVGEFDLKEMDNNIIRKLQVYVKEKLSGENKSKGTLGSQKPRQQEQSSFEVGEQSQS